MDQSQQEQQQENEGVEVGLTANFTLCLGPLAAMYGGDLKGRLVLEAVGVARAHDRVGRILIERDYSRRPVTVGRLYELDGEEFR